MKLFIIVSRFKPILVHNPQFQNRDPLKPWYIIFIYVKSYCEKATCSIAKVQMKEYRAQTHWKYSSTIYKYAHGKTILIIEP